MDGKPNIKPTISPIDYRGSKPTDSKKKTIQSKSLNLKPQITIRKSLKQSWRQKCQQGNVLRLRLKPTDGDWSHRSSLKISHIVGDRSSPKHITTLEIGHVARSSSSLAPHRGSLITTSALAFKPPCSGAPSRYFILLTSLSFSLWLSLSLYLKSLKWNEWDSPSLYSLRLTLSDSFELWLAEALTLLIFCLFLTFWLYLICWYWCWCWWDVNCLLV